MTKSYLRRANADDMDLLFHWANDEATRRNAFNTQQIEYEEHQQWFLEKLKSDITIIFIYYAGETPIGQVRVDINDSNGLISYSIDVDYRSKGHGGRIIEILETTLRAELPDLKVFTARVKKTNIASQRIFERLNYQSTDKDDFIEYVKDCSSIQ